MDAGEIHEYALAEMTLGYFARSYADERTAAAAWQRADEKIRPRDNTSVFRVRRPDGQQVVIVVSQTVREAMNVLRRVAWGGTPCALADDEVESIMARLGEVARADGLNSSARWGGIGGLNLGPEGSQGPVRRPQG